MTGPLSKRLRTLHSLQQQSQNSNEAVPEYKGAIHVIFKVF